MLTNKTRSLNFTQTLDELLSGGKNKREQGGLVVAGRPPTRHGRESVSSSEENRNPSSTSSDSWKIDDSQKSDLSTATDAVENEFLAKLNEIRRRSVVNLKDVKENQRTKQPSEITEEGEDDANNNSTTSKKFVSRPSTAESASTYRVSPPDPKIGSSSGPTTPAPRSLSTTQPVREELKSPPKDQPMQSAFTSRTSQHEVWLKRKIEEERKRKAKQREEAINKEEQEKKRRENAEKLFEIWKRDRDKKEREARRQKSVKEKQEKEAEELLKRERKIEAEKSFEAWKRSHIRTRTSLSKDDAEKQRQKERNSKEAEKAFEAWKKSKDEAEHARRRELAEKEQTKRKQLKEEREYKELLAQQTYETWLELKENERFLAQSMASLNIAKPPLLPWLPASNTCPRQFTPSLKNK